MTSTNGSVYKRQILASSSSSFQRLGSLSYAFPPIRRKMAALSCLKPLSANFSRLTAAATPILLRQLRPYLRSIAAAASPAAAKPQLDVCYSDDECDSMRSLAGVMSASPKADSGESVPERGVQWVFIGFKNKHLCAQRISQLVDVPHICINSLLRQDLSPRSTLYKQIAAAVNQGKLVPEEIVFELLSKRLEDGQDKGETGFILDGIPRTRTQAKILDQLVDIDLVVNFKCTKDYIMENYRDIFFSHSHGSVATQSRFSLSEEERLWRQKALLYMNQVKPLEDYYKKQKKIIDVQVSNAPGETWQVLLSALHLRHVNASRSRLPVGPTCP